MWTLNAYADVMSLALGVVDGLAREQARASVAGVYEEVKARAKFSVDDELPGLGLDSFDVNGTDYHGELAEMAGIKPEQLMVRLYPTNLADDTTTTWRTVFQDRAAPIDAGTPTCITWQTVGKLRRDGIALDQFVFHMDGESRATNVSIVAAGVVMRSTPGGI